MTETQWCSAPVSDHDYQTRIEPHAGRPSYGRVGGSASRLDVVTVLRQGRTQLQVEHFQVVAAYVAPQAGPHSSGGPPPSLLLFVVHGFETIHPRSRVTGEANESSLATEASLMCTTHQLDGSTLVPFALPGLTSTGPSGSQPSQETIVTPLAYPIGGMLLSYQSSKHVSISTSCVHRERIDDGYAARWGGSVRTGHTPTIKPAHQVLMDEYAHVFAAHQLVPLSDAFWIAGPTKISPVAVSKSSHDATTAAFAALHGVIATCAYVPLLGCCVAIVIRHDGGHMDIRPCWTAAYDVLALDAPLAATEAIFQGHGLTPCQLARTHVSLVCFGELVEGLVGIVVLHNELTSFIEVYGVPILNGTLTGSGQPHCCRLLSPPQSPPYRVLSPPVLFPAARPSPSPAAPRWPAQSSVFVMASVTQSTSPSPTSQSPPPRVTFERWSIGKSGYGDTASRMQMDVLLCMDVPHSASHSNVPTESSFRVAFHRGSVVHATGGAAACLAITRCVESTLPRLHQRFRGLPIGCSPVSGSSVFLRDPCHCSLGRHLIDVAAAFLPPAVTQDVAIALFRQMNRDMDVVHHVEGGGGIADSEAAEDAVHAIIGSRLGGPLTVLGSLLHVLASGTRRPSEDSPIHQGRSELNDPPPLLESSAAVLPSLALYGVVPFNVFSLQGGALQRPAPPSAAGSASTSSNASSRASRWRLCLADQHRALILLGAHLTFESMKLDRRHQHNLPAMLWFLLPLAARVGWPLYVQQYADALGVADEHIVRLHMDWSPIDQEGAAAAVRSHGSENCHEHEGGSGSTFRDVLSPDVLVSLVGEESCALLLDGQPPDLGATLRALSDGDGNHLLATAKRLAPWPCPLAQHRSHRKANLQNVRRAQPPPFPENIGSPADLANGRSRLSYDAFALPSSHPVVSAAIVVDILVSHLQPGFLQQRRGISPVIDWEAMGRQLYELRWDANRIADFAPTVALIFQQALHCCALQPRNDWSNEFLHLVGRQDLAWNRGGDAQNGWSGDTKPTAAAVDACIRSAVDALQYSRHLLQASADDDDGVQLPPRHLRRWCDSRIDTVQGLLNTAVPMQLATNAAENQEVSHSLMKHLTKRHLALSVGRGMFTLGTNHHLLRDTVPIPKLDLTGVTTDFLTISGDPKLHSAERLAWPMFHNAVAAGLRFLPLPPTSSGGSDRDEEQQRASTRHWVVFQTQALAATSKDTRVGSGATSATSPNTSRAGMLLAAGLLGHLRSLQVTDIFTLLAYPTQGGASGLLSAGSGGGAGASQANLLIQRDATSIALILGLCASFRGTSQEAVSRCVAVHVQSLTPNAEDLEVSLEVQTASVLCMGLLHEGTCAPFLIETMLGEMVRLPTDEHCRNRQGYILAAGMSLGLLLLGRGTENGCGRLRIQDRLFAIIDNEPREKANKLSGPWQHIKERGGEEQREYLVSRLVMHSADAQASKVACNLVLESNQFSAHGHPAAIMALGLMFLQTGNIAVANRLAPASSLQRIREMTALSSMLRTMCSIVIRWPDAPGCFGQFHDVKAAAALPKEAGGGQPAGPLPSSMSLSFLKNFLPPTLLHHCRGVQAGAASKNLDLTSTENSFYSMHLGCIIAGACLGLGLRFAGTMHPDARTCLIEQLKAFTGGFVGTSGVAMTIGQRKTDVFDSCVSAIALALALVVAGSGDVAVLALLRGLHTRQNCEYGDHMAIGMAIGFVFLGAGRLTVSNSLQSTALLMISLFPKWPADGHDNTHHLQAFRHLYVMALVNTPRWLEAFDVATRQPVSICARLVLAREDETSSLQQGGTVETERGGAEGDAGDGMMSKIGSTWTPVPREKENRTLTVVTPCLLPADVAIIDCIEVRSVEHFPLCITDVGRLSNQRRLRIGVSRVPLKFGAHTSPVIAEDVTPEGTHGASLDDTTGAVNVAAAAVALSIDAAAAGGRGGAPRGEVDDSFGLHPFAYYGPVGGQLLHSVNSHLCGNRLDWVGRPRPTCISSALGEGEDGTTGVAVNRPLRLFAVDEFCVLLRFVTTFLFGGTQASSIISLDTLELARMMLDAHYRSFLQATSARRGEEDGGHRRPPASSASSATVHHHPLRELIMDGRSCSWVAAAHHDPATGNMGSSLWLSEAMRFHKLSAVRSIRLALTPLFTAAVNGAGATGIACPRRPSARDRATLLVVCNATGVPLATLIGVLTACCDPSF